MEEASRWHGARRHWEEIGLAPKSGAQVRAAVEPHGVVMVRIQP